VHAGWGRLYQTNFHGSYLYGMPFGYAGATVANAGLADFRPLS
jgi:hypothetical protein